MSFLFQKIDKRFHLYPQNSDDLRVKREVTAVLAVSMFGDILFSTRKIVQRRHWSKLSLRL